MYQKVYKYLWWNRRYNAHKFYTLHQAPILLNKRHLLLVQAELSAVLSPEMGNEIFILQWKLIFFASPDQHRQLGFQALLQMFHRPSCSFECSCHSKVAVINIFNMIIMLAVSFFLEPCVHFSFREKPTFKAQFKWKTATHEQSND